MHILRFYFVEQKGFERVPDRRITMSYSKQNANQCQFDEEMNVSGIKFY